MGGYKYRRRKRGWIGIREMRRWDEGRFFFWPRKRD
jgi:hypothetical protein